MIGLLTHLNGLLTAALLCALLFVDEVGVPLPFAPNEVLLLISGLLIGTDVLVPWLFVPLALVAMAAGMLTGFVWARTLGTERLHGLAERINAERAYERAVGRLQATSVAGIAIARVLPGVRVYATLAAGASGVPVRRFLLGALPALVLWLAALVLIGDLAGRPAAGLISRVDAVLSTGVLLALLGMASLLVVRHVPRDRIGADRMSTVPRGLRVAMALVVDIGVIGGLVTALASLAGHLFHVLRQINGVLGITIVVLVGYVVAARRGTGATLGERLLTVDLRAALAKRWAPKPGDRPNGEAGDADQPQAPRL